MKKQIAKAFGIGAIVLSSLFGSGCGKGVPKPDYTIVEHLGDKIMTAGIGYKYDFREGGEKGKIVYTIEPCYSGKLKNALLSDNFYLKDAKGNVLNMVDGKIVTVSSSHKVYDPENKQEKTISRKLGSDFLGKMARLMFDKDGYFVKDLQGNKLLDVQETWASVLSPWLREYEINNPKTGEEIGVIKNKFRAGSLFGAQTYQASLKDKDPETVKNLALIVRIIDRIEDLEDED